MNNSIKIIIVDDHQIVRQGLKSLLFGINDIKCIAQASSAKDLFVKLKKNKPDVLILDIGLPDKSGIEITKILTDKFPKIKIIILTANVDQTHIINSVKAGARGFLPKNTSKDEFVRAIRTVYKDDEFFGKGISKIIYKSFVKNIKPEKKSDKILSERETEVLKLICEGYSNKQIAEKLFISVRTVEAHKKNILDKLNLANTVELVKYAIKKKIVTI